MISHLYQKKELFTHECKKFVKRGGAQAHALQDEHAYFLPKKACLEPQERHHHYLKVLVFEHNQLFRP